MVLTLEREVDQFLDTSSVEGLNPTWHSAGLVVLGNLTVTMAEMWESFVKVESGWVLSKYVVVKNCHKWFDWSDCDL